MAPAPIPRAQAAMNSVAIHRPHLLPRYAGNNVIAAAAQDSQSRGSSFETRSTGFTLDSDAFYDTRGRGNANLHETTTARGVEITSSQGNASLSAGGTAFVEGAQINAPQGTASISGANVLIQAGVNTSFS